MFTLGTQPLRLPSFTLGNVNNVPKESGVYIIYEPSGPFYVGRSGSNIRARLNAHLTGHGNANVKLARKLREVAPTLTFTYFLVPKESQREVESALIAFLGVARMANMRREGMFEDQW
jgi:hypothetical protein